MKTLAVKNLRVFILTFLLLYAGAVQALGACSFELDHTSTFHFHHATSHHEIASDSTESLHSSDTIYCLRMNLQVPPRIEAPYLNRASSSDIDFSLNTAATPWGYMNVHGLRGLSLKLLRYKASSISFPTLTPLRVFLSVFQI